MTLTQAINERFMMKMHKGVAVASLLFAMLFGCVNALMAETLVGKWVVDFEKTAQSIKDPDKAKGFREASSGGIKIEMEYLPDGTTRVKRSAGGESEERQGTYKITEQRAGMMKVEVTSAFAGLRYADVLQSPGDYLGAQVMMKGQFHQLDKNRKSFDMKQGDDIIEVCYEELPVAVQGEITKQKDSSGTPVSVAGVLQKFDDADDVFFIEATGVSWGQDVMGTEEMEVTFLDADHLQMGKPGDQLLLIWRREK